MTQGASGISACIIARDEAGSLPRCIASLGGICDEIVVLDTGSVDDTWQVAASLGARVSRDTSCNGTDGLIADFSLARNLCLRQASHPWILQIDADEVLRTGHALLRAAVERDDADVLGITLRNASRAWVGTRFFRAHAVRGYEGLVHERLDHSARYAAEPGVVIENLPDKTGKESSSERNLRLSRLAVQRRPEDSRAWYYLGNEERRAGDYDAAIEAYRQAIAGGRHPLSAYHSRYYIAVCHFLRERHHDALAATDDAIAVDPRYAEAHCLRGDIHLLLEALTEATDDYRRALDCGTPPEDAVFALDPACYRDYPASRLAWLATHRTTEGTTAR